MICFDDKDKNYLLKNVVQYLAFLEYFLDGGAKIRELRDDHLALQGPRDGLNIGFHNPGQGKTRRQLRVRPTKEDLICDTELLDSPLPFPY